MTKGDLMDLCGLLEGLYSEKFPALPPAMAAFWLDDLKHLDLALVRQAVRRWVRFHTHKAPSLDELLEQVEFVREEQRRLTRQGSPLEALDPLTVLHDAARAQAAHPMRGGEDASYVRLMVMLTERHVGRWQDEQGMWRDKLTYDQMAHQCGRWAREVEEHHPRLARDLMAAAMQFARMEPVETTPATADEGAGATL